MRDELLDVRLEVVDHGAIGVELLDFGREIVWVDVDSAEAEEVEFAAVVVVLLESAPKS